MSVAPELPPVPVARRGGSGPAVRGSARRARSSLRAVPVLVDRTPAGVVAVVEPIRRPVALVERTAPPAVLPTPVVRPTLDWPDEEPTGLVADPAPGRGLHPATDRELHPAGDRELHPATGGELHPAADHDLHPAALVRLRPTGARVVRPARTGLRLTRRGRLLAAAVTLLIAVLTLVGVAGRVGSLSESAPVPASAPSQVVVAPGETLWSIAERVAPQRDPRPVIAQIRHLNGLPSGDVQVGQTLLLRAP